MKKMNWMFAALVLLLTGIAGLRGADQPARPRSAREVLDFWVSETEKLVVPAADAMPEDKYSFAPSNGEFKGVRTFAEQVKHLAAANYQLGAGCSGRRSACRNAGRNGAGIDKNESGNHGVFEGIVRDAAPGGEFD